MICWQVRWPKQVIKPSDNFTSKKTSKFCLCIGHHTNSVDGISAKGISQRKDILLTQLIFISGMDKKENTWQGLVIVDGCRLFLNGEIKEICSLKAKQSIIKSLKVYNPWLKDWERKHKVRRDCGSCGIVFLGISNERLMRVMEFFSQFDSFMHGGFLRSFMYLADQEFSHRLSQVLIQWYWIHAS